MVLSILLFLLFITTAMSEPNKTNGFGFLRRQVLELQKKNDQLEGSISLLTLAIEKLTRAIDQLQTSGPEDNAHNDLISSLIVEKIQDSLLFPNRKVIGLQFDKDAGIKYTIEKKSDDLNIIGSNIVYPNENPNSKYYYEVKFFVSVFEDNGTTTLLPAFEDSGEDDHNYDIFMLNSTRSRHFPRVFYETIDENGVIGVAEIR